MAGRKDKNTVDYFPHYCVSGKTMFILESAHGHVGYSVWFKTLELLGSSANHYIDLRDDTDLLFLISKMKITETELNNIYDLLAKLGAIDLLLWSNRIVFSENFIDNISDAYKRRSGDLCMNKLNLCIHLSISCEHKSKNSVQKSTKKRILNKTKEDNIKKDFSIDFLFYKDDFKEIWENEFVDLKKKKKASISERTLNSQLKKIEKLSNGNYAKALEILEKSVNSGWTDFYELKTSSYKSSEKKYTIDETILNDPNRMNFR